MSFVELKICLLSLVIAGAAIAVPFTVVDERPWPTGSEERQSLTTDLKYRAVAEWLQRYLKDRYPQFEKLVTREFAEKHIVTYGVPKAVGNRTQLEVELDDAGLKRWVRLAESKSRETVATLRPVLVVQSKIPGLTINPDETASRSRDSSVIQTLLSMFNTQLHRLNVTLSLPKGSFGFRDRPRGTDEVRSLGSYPAFSGFNGALWVTLSPCKECGGTRIDVALYNLTHGRTALTESNDLPLEGADFGTSDRLKAALKPTVDEVSQQIESLISDGKLFSSSYLLVVEGWPSSSDLKAYRGTKNFVQDLEKLDFVTQALPKNAQSGRIAYEILSPLKPQDLAQSLGETSFQGFRLKVESVDSTSLTMRYFK